MKDGKLETRVEEIDVLLGPKYKLCFNPEIIENKFSENNSTKTSGIFFTNRTYQFKKRT